MFHSTHSQHIIQAYTSFAVLRQCCTAGDIFLGGMLILCLVVPFQILVFVGQQTQFHGVAPAGPKQFVSDLLVIITLGSCCCKICCMLWSRQSYSLLASELHPHALESIKKREKVIFALCLAILKDMPKQNQENSLHALKYR